MRAAIRHAIDAPKTMLVVTLLLGCSSGGDATAPGSLDDTGTVAESPGDESGGGDVIATDGAPSAVPEFGKGTLTVVGTAKDGLAGPRALAFDPEHPERLWTVNYETNGVVIYFHPGNPKQPAEARLDRDADHLTKTRS